MKRLKVSVPVKCWAVLLPTSYQPLRTKTFVIEYEEAKRSQAEDIEEPRSKYILLEFELQFANSKCTRLTQLSNDWQMTSTTLTAMFVDLFDDSTPGLETL